jgi:hypothetical protein
MKFGIGFYYIKELSGNIDFGHNGVLHEAHSKRFLLTSWYILPEIDIGHYISV